MNQTSTQSLRFAYFGTSAFSVFVIDELKNTYNIIPELVVTVPDAPVGRKQILTPSPLKKWAIKHNIPVIQPDSLKEASYIKNNNHEAYQELIKKLSNFDVFLVASYGKIIPDTILNLPKIAPLNIHPSKLPFYRGPSPIQYQILNNEKDIHTTLMIMDAEVDHGDIVAQTKLPEHILSTLPLSFFELEKELAVVSAKLAAPYLKGDMEIKGTPQLHDLATFTKLIKKEDAHIELSQFDENTEDEFSNVDEYKNYLTYLAFVEWPRVYTIDAKHDKRIIITSATYNQNEKQFISLTVIPEGGKEMKFEDYLRGR